MPFLGKKPTEVASPVDINSGTIDGATIGGGSAAPATVTTFTSNGIDDNADATAITINSSEQVGIGGSPSAKFQVKDGHNGIFIGAGTHDTHGAAEHIQFNRGSSAAALASIGIENSSGNTSNGRLMVSSREGIIFNTGGGSLWKQTSEIARMTTSGLCFNGDTAAANALDDYETGTWTPVMIGDGGTNPTVTYGNQVGYYTKVGNVVTVSWYSGALNISNAGSGYAYISGLPYSASTAASHYPVCKVTHNSSTNHACDGGYIYASNLRLMQAGISTSLTTWTSGNPKYLMIGAVYITD